MTLWAVLVVLLISFCFVLKTLKLRYTLLLHYEVHKIVLSPTGTTQYSSLELTCLAQLELIPNEKQFSIPPSSPQQLALYIPFFASVSLKTLWEFLKKLKGELLCDPEMSILGI